MFVWASGVSQCFSVSLCSATEDSCAQGPNTALTKDTAFCKLILESSIACCVLPGIVLRNSGTLQRIPFLVFPYRCASSLKIHTSLAESSVVSWGLLSHLKREEPGSYGVLSALISRWSWWHFRCSAPFSIHASHVQHRCQWHFAELLGFSGTAKGVFYKEVDLIPCLKPKIIQNLNLSFQMNIFLKIFSSFSFEWIFLKCGTEEGFCLHNADIFLPCIHISSWNRGSLSCAFKLVALCRCTPPLLCTMKKST